jgi:CelD/BcsL family acetyltransferase involved in cellulose biosynthesis
VDHLGEERIKTFDFGLGDAFYKKRFGDSSWREGTCRLYAPSVRGALLRSTVTLSTRVDKLGRKVLNATGMTDRFKAGWRRRLAASAPQNVQHD